MRREQLFAAFFFLAFCFLLYQFYRILYDFIGPLSYAALLAFVFFPIHQRLRRLLNGRDGLAATLMTTAVILLVIVPMFYLFALITRESVSLYEDVSEFVTSGRTHEIIDRVRDSRIGHWWTLLGPRLDALNVDLPEIALRGSQTVSRFLVSQAPAAAANVVKGVVNFFFTVFALFFFFRDGERMAAGVAELLPMTPDHKAEILQRLSTTLTAVVQGMAVGLLVSVLFAIVPLLDVRDVKPSLLLRQETEPSRCVRGSFASGTPRARSASAAANTSSAEATRKPRWSRLPPGPMAASRCSARLSVPELRYTLSASGSQTTRMPNVSQ